MISLIWAMDDNRVIGHNNALPWHIPEDLKFFKKVTMGKPIAMGRKTWDSIGRPLPGRENIVITRNQSFTCDSCTVLNSVDALVENSKVKMDEIFVIGGEEIFKLVLPFANRLYITRIHAEFEGDTYFPPLNMDEWKLLSKEKGINEEKHPFDYDFEIYDRK